MSACEHAAQGTVGASVLLTHTFAYVDMCKLAWERRLGDDTYDHLPCLRETHDSSLIPDHHWSTCDTRWARTGSNYNSGLGATPREQ